MKVHGHRTVVERCFNGLKQWRGIATGHDSPSKPPVAILRSAADSSPAPVVRSGTGCG